MKNIIIFHLKIIIFTAVKYHSILHGHVCVMNSILMVICVAEGGNLFSSAVQNKLNMEKRDI